MATIPMDLSEIEQIWKNVQMRKVEPSKEILSPIISFDVSPSGEVAIGLKEDEIRIFDCKNVLISCLKFNNTGNYYIRWNGNNLVIFSVRGSRLLEVTSSGDFVRMCKIDERSFTTGEAWNRINQNHEKTVKGCTYKVKNDMGVFYNIFAAGSYSQLEKTEADGDRILLYDVNAQLLRKNIVITVLALTALGIVIASFIRSCIVHYRKPSRDQAANSSVGTL